MQLAPIVFALIVGWVTGDENLPPTFVDWLEARNTVGVRAPVSADCVVVGRTFKLRQVVLERSEVDRAEP